MARTIKHVDSTEVREWAKDTGWRDELDRPVADRGRMPSGLIDAYNKANKRNFKEYVPIPRPVRADYRDQAEAEKAQKATTPRRSTSGAAAAEKPAKATAAVREVQAVTPVASGEDGVQSLQDVMAMLVAAENKKGGRQAVVTIQTLINV